MSMFGSSGKTIPTSLPGLTAAKASEIKKSLRLDSKDWGDEEIVKFTRQLEFAIAKGEVDAFMNNLLSSRSDEGQRKMVPKTRYGKTNLQISILTCGGMRLQETWCPDNLPLLGSFSPVVGFGMSAINTSCQNNLVATIRRALAIGINHFETARYYGTSEMQFSDALDAMIKSGEIKRSDFILQTKIPPCQKLSELKKQWDASWSLFSKLGHIDLLSSHGLSTDKTYGYVFDNGADSNLPFMQQLVQEGKVLHLGVATHGTPPLVAKLINSGVFSYINLHHHGVFGSYHGSGISDGKGDYGHGANVALAKSLDMGIFVISPYDKGGKLYEPSSTLEGLLGSDLTAIEFQSLYQWGALGGADTIVMGASKPSDFDEAFGIIQRFNMDDPATAKMVSDAAARIRGALDSACGPCGLNGLYQGIPEHMDPVCNGIAIAHMVWMWALVKGLGMFSYAKERFKGLEDSAGAWKKNKSVQENIDAWNDFNCGRSLLTQHEEIPAAALAACPNPDRVRHIVKELHSWFAKDGDAIPTPEQLVQRGWNPAYSLRTWPDYPGTTVDIGGIVLQRLTMGLLGIGGGPTKDSKYVDEVKRTCAYWKSVK